MKGRVLSPVQDTEAGQGVNNPKSGLFPSLREECGGGKPLARIPTPRMRGRPIFLGEVPELADWARLEIVCTPNTGTEGSNPSLSVSGDS